MDNIDSARAQRLLLFWTDLWRRESLPAPQGEPVLQAYAGAARAYHNLEHLEEVLDWTRQLPVEEPVRSHLQIALWYHDVVYDSRRGDNETASAAWAQRDLSAVGYAATAEIVGLILDTKHDREPASSAGQWIVDVDLSILGASSDRFDRYNEAVRAEYRWVPWFLYKRKRRDVLRAFLQRPSIYATEFFKERLEAAARLNLERAIKL
jgi:predicted metal-dependent HD superfamily phosphohydrolase